MPGLNQLKQFTKNMLDLGNEEKIRAEQGEKPVKVPLPTGISEADDSDDFINGMPIESADGQTENNAGTIEESGDSIDDLMASLDDSDLSGFDSPVQTDSNDDDNPLENVDNSSAMSEESSATEVPSSDFADIGGLGDFDDLGSSVEQPAFDDISATDFSTDLTNKTESREQPSVEEQAEDEPIAASDENDIQNSEFEPLDSDFLSSSPSGSEVGDFDNLNTENLDTNLDNNIEDNDVSSDFSNDFSSDISSSSDDFSVPSASEESASASPAAEPEMEDFSDALGGMEDDIDFSDEFPPTGAVGSGGFELDNEVGGGFDIEGFTDREYADTKKKSESEESVKEKNSFTDREYEQFKKNFALYPLNVRVAIEEMIVGDQFNDDVVFEVLEKVLKKVPARQLAGHLEKLLDKTISVPRDYEKRSAEEYEAYKQSTEYLIKNKILPGILVGVAGLIVLFTLCLLGNHFIVKPSIASSLYKKGYVMLENNEYPESEAMFNRAVKYKAKKGWFYKYAEGYRNHKQHRRAADMYERTLRYFNQDKKAGMDYARMELDDYEDYEKAETILKREVLDYHINDKDGMLLLGDIYLEWGTEKDPSKLEDAKEQYMELMQLYKVNNLYQSRMMRYYIRNDNLYEVLQCKNQFYPNKKSIGAEDWIELSGYMLDKLYGTIKPKEMYLRESIEDVRDMLERALQFAPTSAIAHYNMGRYFVHTDNNASARLELSSALSAFEALPMRKRRDTYKYIDTYRLLGEQYIETREYIKAEEILGNGITFYEAEKHNTGFTGDKNTGILYSDRGDLDYFITGDLDSAHRNYQNAIELGNDTASIRYKSGFIEYMNRDYDSAMISFIHSSEMQQNDTHLLLALGNTLSLRGDNFAAQGYYEDLMKRLDIERSKHAILLPQVRDDQGDIVDLYMRASNNLGVTEYRLARQTGDSTLNASAIANLSISARAYDALTRNQVTMVRLDGSNLAVQNSKYMTQSSAMYEPEIYTEISRVLNGEKGFEE